jgi:hypothetical protein
MIVRESEARWARNLLNVYVGCRNSRVALAYLWRYGGLLLC